jgi:pSer/pThr/pTyr-binding forkhead associated (FHA) protein
MGLDFRIYEGNNTIGRDPENTITVASDSAISGKHVTILFRMNKFYIKDEMAVNGTFLNEELIEIGKPYELNDGDTIRLGGTSLFKFKSAL